MAIALAVFGGGTASASSDETTAMSLGAVTTAPAGFVEMCERTPTECLAVARPTDQMLADVRDWAGRARWAFVFQASGIATAAPPQAIDFRSAEGRAEMSDLPTGAATPPVKPKAMTPEAVRALKDQSRKRRRSASTKAPPAVAPQVPASSPTLPVVAPARQSRPVADVTTEALEAVNRRLNRAIRRASDADAFGREDVWVLPEGRRPSGDCEDYVLAKRRALIEDGVDPAALSIAVVRTRRGEVHAVLLVATPDGEKVLDNLSPWVLPWGQAPYDWLERQAPGQPQVWVHAAA